MHRMHRTDGEARWIQQRSSRREENPIAKQARHEAGELGTSVFSGARTFLSAAACSVQVAPASHSTTQFASCCGQECPRAATVHSALTVKRRSGFKISNLK